MARFPKYGHEKINEGDSVYLDAAGIAHRVPGHQDKAARVEQLLKDISLAEEHHARGWADPDLYANSVGYHNRWAELHNEKSEKERQCLTFADVEMSFAGIDLAGPQSGSWSVIIVGSNQNEGRGTVKIERSKSKVVERKVGDVVALNGTREIRMTVTDLSGEVEGFVKVVWFNENKESQRNEFPINALCCCDTGGNEIISYGDSED